jgi:hypothetical protein
MTRVHRVPAKAGARNRPRPEVFDKHVRSRDQSLEDVTPLRRLEVDGNAFLVAVDAEEIGALLAEKRRPPVARVIAFARMLNLDDARAKIGEHHRAVRPRQHSRQIDDGKS